MAFLFSDLQNGSDIRGVALSGVEGQEVNLTAGRVARIAGSFATWLAKKHNLELKEIAILVGRDSRLSGEELLHAACSGIVHKGGRSADTGLASTPAMFMSTITKGYLYNGAIMLTASHLPYNRNGMKFFTPDGGLDKTDIKEILALAEADEDISIDKGYRPEKVDFMPVYANQLVEKIRKAIRAENQDKPLEGLHIVVDAGNGAGGFFAEKVLQPLGVDTTGSQFLEPDGRFPNHIPNPEDKKAMESIQKAVLSNKADLGIIFDTDVDRAAVVDHNGNPINRNGLIALISAIVLEEHPQTTIVTDSITSEGLSEFINTELKGHHLRYKRGYKNVINKARELNDTGTPSWLAIETSGHGALKENYFLDDGAFLVAKILIKLGKEWQKGNKKIAELIKNLKNPVEAEEFRFSMQTKSFAQYGQNIVDDLKVWASQQDQWTIPTANYEGIRVSCKKPGQDGWFLLRLSLHDPVMPLNVESNLKNGVQGIIQELYQFLKKYDKLDLLPIVTYLGNKE